MRFPGWLHPPLIRLRSLVSRLQRWPGPPAAGPAFTVPAGQHPQPDHTSCGSSVLVMMRMLTGEQVHDFAAAALATRRRTNSWHDRSAHLQLPWPASLGTRPAALIRDLGEDRVNRVVDPYRPQRAYAAIVASLARNRPVPLYIGEGSWMQHIALVVAASDDALDLYEPSTGRVVTRTREQFQTAQLRLAGWDQPWLVILPRD